MRVGCFPKLLEPVDFVVCGRAERFKQGRITRLKTRDIRAHACQALCIFIFQLIQNAREYICSRRIHRSMGARRFKRFRKCAIGRDERLGYGLDTQWIVLRYCGVYCRPKRRCGWTDVLHRFTQRSVRKRANCCAGGGIGGTEIMVRRVSATEAVALRFSVAPSCASAEQESVRARPRYASISASAGIEAQR